MHIKSAIVKIMLHNPWSTEIFDLNPRFHSILCNSFLNPFRSRFTRHHRMKRMIRT